MTCSLSILRFFVLFLLLVPHHADFHQSILSGLALSPPASRPNEQNEQNEPDESATSSTNAAAILGDVAGGATKEKEGGKPPNPTKPPSTSTKPPSTSTKPPSTPTKKPSPSTNSPSPNSTDQSATSSTNVGAIVGGVLGAVAALVVIFLVARIATRKPVDHPPPGIDLAPPQDRPSYIQAAVDQNLPTTP